jgi:hypothetical protein
MLSRNLLAAAIPAMIFAGCNSADTVLRTASDTSSSQPVTSAAPLPVPSVPGPAASPVSLAAVRLHLAPLVGAPLAAVMPLSKRLNAEARSRKLTLVSAGAPGTTHVVKGYFTAFADSGQTTVIFVWDVLDASGRRLHRIQGQKQNAGANAADPWTTVKPETMEAVAVESMNQLTAYLGQPRSV